MSSPSFSAYDDHAPSPQHANGSTARLSFVLPPLSAVKAQKGKKKIKLTVSEPVKQQKQPRPIKLKPLKEVLTKLIAQIKKKDDYAFFLHPVDPAQVPGYSDVVSRPMDLGTMTVKVEKGKYRSLEEFASDLKLVTTNAKTFNPPGTIYYTEAERIEAYALDHITKAAATVIEYETDWNIDVEKDDELVAVDDEDGSGNPGRGTPMDIDGSRAGSPSVMSVQVGGKRGKGKKMPGTLTESLEADGGLPGAKVGLGAFPPGSDWAELMLALKLKGKRYRTKKERMRMEKGGPPIAADGSLDYPEMEDPFTVLSAMVPDPPSRPQLIPLYPTLDPSNPSQPPFPAPVNILTRPEVPNPSVTPAPVASGSKLKTIKPKKRRHWIINKNAPSRYRARDLGEEEAVPAWKTPREPMATDFGTFATLPSVLAEERNARDFATELGSEEKMFGVLRNTLQPPYTSQPEATVETDEDGYWKGRAGEAEAYIRDVVYGGVEGYAYVRSLAEFLTPSEPMRRNGEPPTYGALGMPVAHWVEHNVLDPLTDGRHGILRDAVRILNALPPTPPPSAPSASPASSPHPLPPAPAPVAPPMSPAALRRQVELCLHAYPSASRALATLNAIRAAKIDLGALIRAPDELFHAEDVWAGREYRERKKREMEEALARDPEKNAAAYLQWAIAEHREAEASAGLGAANGKGAGAGAGTGAAAAAAEEPGMLEYALQVAAEEIARLAKEGVGVGAGRMQEDGSAATGAGAGEAAQVEPAVTTKDASEPKATDMDGDVMMKTEEEEESVGEASPPPPHTSPAALAGDGATTAATASTDKGEEEDPSMKKLRLNLLALAKRAPLDQIMKLPPELVPAHLRHIVPTVDP